jgi:predicted amidohydrolase
MLAAMPCHAMPCLVAAVSRVYIQSRAAVHNKAFTLACNQLGLPNGHGLLGVRGVKGAAAWPRPSDWVTWGHADCIGQGLGITNAKL